MITDLLGEVGDTIITFDPYDPYTQSYMYIIAEDEFTEWGLTKDRKHYTQETGLLHRNFSYTLDIGIDNSVTGIPVYSMYSARTLKGCIIDGVIYGDTTTVGVDDDESPIVNEFRLEQNYPNPFNPSTVINYQLPVSSKVTLKVYDILGNEVATLVNEELPAGEYEVEFSIGRDSSPDIASGIYFYQLQAGGPETSSGHALIQSKKMILIK